MVLKLQPAPFWNYNSVKLELEHLVSHIWISHGSMWQQDQDSHVWGEKWNQMALVLCAAYCMHELTNDSCCSRVRRYTLFTLYTLTWFTDLFFWHWTWMQVSPPRLKTQYSTLSLDIHFSNTLSFSSAAWDEIIFALPGVTYSQRWKWALIDREKKKKHPFAIRLVYDSQFLNH